MDKKLVRRSGLPEYDTPFWSFILDPVEIVRLKTLFDNARNYTILVVLLGGGIVILREATTVFAVIAGISLSVAGGAMGIFNVMQSWVISLRLFDQYHGFNNLGAC